MIDITLAHAEIKKAKTPREALSILSRFNDWFDGSRPEEARLYAWCLWLKENGYEDWVEYIKIVNRALQALLSGDPDEMEFYTERLRNTKPPKGWIEDFKDYLKGRKA